MAEPLAYRRVVEPALSKWTAVLCRKLCGCGTLFVADVVAPRVARIYAADTGHRSATTARALVDEDGRVRHLVAGRFRRVTRSASNAAVFGQIGHILILLPLPRSRT